MINTFIHSCSFLKNHTWFQTKMGKICTTHFHTKTAQKLLWGITYLFGLCTGVPPPPPRGRFNPTNSGTAAGLLAREKLWMIAAQFLANSFTIIKWQRLSNLTGMQGAHEASEIREFSVYYTEFSNECLVAYDYFLFRCGASFKIFHCDITPSFSCN